jgi:hypothetical protein
MTATSLIALVVGVPLLWVFGLKMVVGSVRGRRNKGKWSLAIVRAAGRGVGSLKGRAPR